MTNCLSNHKATSADLQCISVSNSSEREQSAAEL